MMQVSKTVHEVWKFRALVVALAERHLASRYRGSFLGFLWSVLNPLFLMLVYFLVFRFYMRTNFVEHYHVFLFCGLLPWAWTTSALMEGTSSIVSGGHLITKSLFPAQLLPVVSVITSLVNFLLSLPLLALFMVGTGVPFHLMLLGLPVLIAVQFCFLFGVTLALAALNVLFRDVQHILGNLISLLFFLCPIVYPATVVPEKFRFSLDLNPFALFIQFYHSLFLEGTLPPLMMSAYLLAWTMLMVWVGCAVFNHYRESFAELV